MNKALSWKAENKGNTEIGRETAAEQERLQLFLRKVCHNTLLQHHLYISTTQVVINVLADRTVNAAVHC